jgi:ABC-type Mn2+/Zn2+ transport system permease subunit
LLTEKPEEAREKKLKLWWWDLFFTQHSLVVTSSVKVAGVLLVFAYLINTGNAAINAVEGHLKE